MRAHRTEAVAEQDGTLKLEHLPIKTGDRVEVIVLIPEEQREAIVQFPLPGPYRFEDPFSPVGVEDWEALK